MHLIQSVHKKFVLLALVASIALSLCPIDHFMPMAEATAHSEAAITDCMLDVCAALESKKAVSQDKITQAKLLLVPVPTSTTFIFQTRAVWLGIIGDSSPPPALNKIYQLHATYLI